jgi:hypothetical protein
MIKYKLIAKSVLRPFKINCLFKLIIKYTKIKINMNVNNAKNYLIWNKI